MIRRPPRSTLLPYTTLSRSTGEEEPMKAARLAPAAALAAAVVAPAVAQQAPTARKVISTREAPEAIGDRKSTRLNFSHANNSYAVFCLKKKKQSTHIYPPLP